MKVSKCENCRHYRRKMWTTSYKPAGYHRIGISHAYGFCALHNDRCLNVKNCEVEE